MASNTNNVRGLDGKPLIVNSKQLDSLKAEYEAEYEKFNTAALAVMPTEKLKELQSAHFEKATAFINNGNMLLQHVAMISKIIHSRIGK